MGELYNFEKIFSLLDNLSNFQKSRIPLCAAENVISNFCKLPLDGDIQERYIMGNYYTYSEKNNFIGSQYLVPIYEQIHNVCKLLFNTKYTDARTLSGMNCVTTLLMSLTNSGDKIAILSPASGGHPSILPVCERLGLHVYELPYDYINFDLNYEEANYIIEAENIHYILLAPSDIIKPMDIQNLMLDNSILLYDISQIMGLIAGKQISNPLKISSNVVLLGGTHKTLPGPASGLIMTNNEEIHQTIERNINPKYLRHTQMHQVISLLLALIENEVYGQEYAKTTPNAPFIDHIKQKLPPKKIMYTFPDDVIDNFKLHLHKE